MESASTRNLKRAGMVLAVVGITLAVGLWFLSRFVAETRGSSFIIGAIWVAAVGGVTLAYVRSRPEIRKLALGGFAVMVLGVAAVGWWTGVRETSVDEDVVVAGERAAGKDRDAALAGDGGNSFNSSSDGGGGSGGGEVEGGGGQQVPSEPTSLSTGSFEGVDGHDGKGKAEYVNDGNDRKVTFTNFKVDPGPNVVVWLTKNSNDLDDRIELGKMKGSSGNQQYSIPSDANLRKYDTVVLYCTPFTVRVAVAELS